LFRWNYGTLETPQHGIAAVVASDRKITYGDIEYEPPQLKLAFFPHAVILIAGDFSLHSEALRAVQKNVRQDSKPENIALRYGQAIQAVKRRHAEDIYLAPIGLNTDTFLSQQKELSVEFVDRITSQLQKYEGDDVEALVVGSDGENAHVHTVDTRGKVGSADDIGFAAIGVGAWHAKSLFMQNGYSNVAIYAHALAITYAAKRAAEIAPGVGKTATDMYLITKDVIEPVRPDVMGKLPELYETFYRKRQEFAQEIVDGLAEFIARPAQKQESSDEGIGDPTKNSPPDGSASSSTTEAPQQNETGPKPTKT